MRKTPSLKLKDDPGNRCRDKWHFDGDLSALSDPSLAPSRAKAKRSTVVDEEDG